MGKIKRYIIGTSFSGLFFLIPLFFGMLTESCSEEPTSMELQYLDTLDYKLRGNEQALSIDPQELVRRKDLIRHEWLAKAKDTFPDVAVKLTDDLNGILTAYDHYLNNHLLMISANKLLLAEVEQFRQETASGISRKEFKEKYAGLNSRIEKTGRDIERVARPVYALEPMWLRLEKLFRDKR